MKWNKKLCAMLLAMAMSLSFAACSDSAAEEPVVAQDVPASDVVEDTQPEEAVEEEPAQTQDASLAQADSDVFIPTAATVEEVVPAGVYDGIIALNEGLYFAYVDDPRTIVLYDAEDNIIGELEGNDYYQAGADGVVRIYQDGLWGLIDTEGNEVLAPTYLSMGSFSEGFSIVSTESGYGFINTSGEEVVPTVYDAVRSFSSGMAMVSVGEFSGYVNTAGELVIPAEYLCDSFSMAVDFTDEAILLKNEVDGETCYYHVTNTGVVTALEALTIVDFSEYAAFHNGVAALAVWADGGYHTYFIDTAGEIIPAEVAVYAALPYNIEGESLYMAYKRESDMDLRTEVYEVELCVVDGTTGQVVADGVVAYEMLCYTVDGGLIFEYDPWGGISLTFYDATLQQIVVSGDLTLYDDFVGGTAIVLTNDEDNLIGLINTAGEIVLPCEYNNMSAILENGFVYLGKDGLYGVVSIAGELLVPLEYTKVSISSDGTTILMAQDGSIYRATFE